MGAVFDHDCGGGNVSGNRAMLFDFKTLEGAEPALQRTVNHDFPGNGIGVYVSQFSDG